MYYHFSVLRDVTTKIEREMSTFEIRDLSNVQPVVLNPFGEPLTDADIRYAFNKVDRNKDGRISLKEFSSTLAGLQIEIDKNKLRTLFEELDSDHK